MKPKVLFTASEDYHILAFHQPYFKWFAEQSWEVHIACRGDATVPYCHRKYNISFARNPLHPQNITAYRQLRQLFDEEEFHLVHTHTPAASVITRAAFPHRKYPNSTVMYTAHGFHFHRGAPLSNWLISYPMEYLMSWRTDLLVLINREDYDRAGRFRCKRELVPGVGVNRIKSELSKQQRASLRASIGIPADAVVLMYAAELSKNKNQIWLVELLKPLFAQYQHLHLVLAGKENSRGEVEAFISANNLDQQIHYIGFRTDIMDVFAASDITVSASLREGLPVNIMEAMFSQLPVVATDTRGQRDLVHNDVTGFVVPVTEPDTFRNKVELLVQDPALREKMGTMGEKAAQPYLLDSVLPTMAAVYRRQPGFMHGESLIRCEEH